MITDKKRCKLYWAFKIGGVLISCLFPIWAICEKFPVWNTVYSTGRTVGVGAILILIVVVIVFRKAVFRFLAEKLKLTHTPPILIWLVMLIVSYVLMYLADFIRDLNTMLWMGLIGCAIGTLLTFIGEYFFGKKEENK